MSVLRRGEEGRVFRGGPLPQSLMGSFGVVLLSPQLDDGTGFRHGAEVMLVQALVPRSAVEASMKQFSIGWPGRVKASAMPRSLAH